MPKYNIHVCIVSDQPIPNYVPVLDNTFRPREVILLVTGKMQQKAAALEQTLKTRCGVKTRQIAIASEYDMQEMEDKVLGELIALDEAKENIALNLTGGTKLMAIAAYRTFHDAGYPAFYFTATSNEVLLLDNNERLTLQPPKIKIEDYLRLHGYQIAANNQVQRSVPPGRQKIGETLAIAPERFADALTILNGDISAAIENNSNTLDILLRKPTVKNLDGFLHHNALYVLECKTKNYNNKNEGQAQNELYKLETLKKLGGLRTKTAFVSYRALKAHVRDRAKGANIEIIEQKDLQGFKTRLKNWMTQQTP